jgi:hypothetical protein
VPTGEKKQQSPPGGAAGTLSPVRFDGRNRELRRFPAIFRGIQPGFPAPQTVWRRGRDSNPRYPLRYAGFQDRCHQPLGHLSRTTTVLLQYAVCPRVIGKYFLVFQALTTIPQNRAEVFKTACFNHSHIPPGRALNILTRRSETDFTNKFILDMVAPPEVREEL